MTPLVVHVTTVPQTLGFFRGQVGHLKAHGFRVAVVSSPGAALEEFGAAEDVPATAVPMQRRLSPLHDIRSLLALVRVFATLKPAIVHSHTPKAALLGTIAARLTGRLAVLSIFGLPQMTARGWGVRLLDAKTRLECAIAHRVWCDSFSVRDVLIARKLCAARKVVVLGSGSVNGVDADGRFNPARFDADAKRVRKRQWTLPDDAVVIGFIGRVVRDKGIRELTEAWQRLRTRHPRLHLLIVGETEPTDPIDGATERLLRSDARVRLTGPVRDVTPLLAIMDVFVLPSYREGFGVTNIEAAAMAVPVVATRIPGCVDSVADGETGTLVPAGDATSLADAVDRYLEDPGLRRQHGEAGRRRVLEQFRQERIWQELASLYRSLLDG